MTNEGALDQATVSPEARRRPSRHAGEEAPLLFERAGWRLTTEKRCGHRLRVW